MISRKVYFTKYISLWWWISEWDREAPCIRVYLLFWILWRSFLCGRKYINVFCVTTRIPRKIASCFFCNAHASIPTYDSLRYFRTRRVLCTTGIPERKREREKFLKRHRNVCDESFCTCRSMTHSLHMQTLIFKRFHIQTTMSRKLNLVLHCRLYIVYSLDTKRQAHIEILWNKIVD